MSTAQQIETPSVEDYLAGERHSEVRHEYLAGAVYAMAGASEEHNLIAGNLFAALRRHLAGGPCRVFIADMKLRVQEANDEIFYYPDVMVTCDPGDDDRYFKRHPRVLIEVLSPETERTDRREKFLSYTRLASLEEYLLVAQDRLEVTVFRRANDWNSEVRTSHEQSAALPSLDCSLPLASIYEGVNVAE